MKYLFGFNDKETQLEFREGIDIKYFFNLIRSAYEEEIKTIKREGEFIWDGKFYLPRSSLKLNSFKEEITSEGFSYQTSIIMGNGLFLIKQENQNKKTQRDIDRLGEFEKSILSFIKERN